MTSTDLLVSGPPAWPGCALGAWSAAWRAGRCAPDDVTDTLTEFADRHEITDPQGFLGDLRADDARLNLLALLRRATSFEVRLPTAGDPQGLPPDPATTAALEAGEVLLLHNLDRVVGLTPTRTSDGVCRWSAHRYAVDVPWRQPRSLGEVEYELREAIRDTASIIGGLGSTGARTSPTELRAALARLTFRHQVALPPHDDVRATRVIDSAAQVEAIVALTGAHAPTFGVVAAHIDHGDARLRRLAALARSARAAAVNTVIGEFSGPSRLG
ncbi:hypothetical protein AAFP30_12795 [Gordonia sp. CPCC 205515]|uniref:hypothetical protein n=1 Tax=Gordonia sp. CPCC 205515 TaxID=3140791 RepID=UPI003AF395D9